jgi:methionine-rich copper-binding protein CopC
MKHSQATHTSVVAASHDQVEDEQPPSTTMLTAELAAVTMEASDTPTSDALGVYTWSGASLP